jgi:hypothetical protein
MGQGKRNQMKLSKEAIDEAADYILPFMTLKEYQLQERFLRLGNAYSFGKKDYKTIIVPGQRQNKVAIIAHVDTVINDSKNLAVTYDKGLFSCGTRKRYCDKDGDPCCDGGPIGADDRAGVAMLWNLRELGHTLILTNGEESGCLSSMQLMSDEEQAQFVASHQFAVQLDRKGRNDLVFYNVGSEDFAKYCIEQTGYEFAQGTSTDICVLCEKICGVNMSVGYRNEHTENEVLNVRWWIRTLSTLKRWLAQENLPRFER